ncbi:SRPBCC domain-containing protein [Chryseobacterium sp. MEBOG06]|uniref:SRPBCC family protein n=1 Tax=Chryseobacterium sp. MEBOG06 TaxID=2879938 RepID=UPI001F24A1C9|nr:SRPBCC domain-containing protein [Chryseobacterium sp. MEBOG06]UKB82151.1 SRPBCC domain-containing protein [Chryseobacterium sp. MEBOG06]
METLSYETVIDAPLQKVWDILWSPETYSQWTQYFGTGSIMKSDWKVGGTTYFLNHKGEGIVSTIDSLDEPNQIVFKHLGLIKDGTEDTQSKEVMEWSGYSEKYFLIDFDGKTKLHTEIQTEKEWEDHMNTGFTKGLMVVKSLAEGVNLTSV